MYPLGNLGLSIKEVILRTISYRSRMLKKKRTYSFKGFKRLFKWLVSKLRPIYLNPEYWLFTFQIKTKGAHEAFLTSQNLIAVVFQKLKRPSLYIFTLGIIPLNDSHKNTKHSTKITNRNKSVSAKQLSINYE